MIHIRIKIGLAISNIIFMAGVLCMPIVSFAFFPTEIKKMHEESKEHVERERDKFRQDILEKRKELLQEWRQKRRGLKERFEKGREHITLGLQEWRESMQKEKNFFNHKEENMISMLESTSSNSFLNMFGKSVESVLHIFSPLMNL